MPGGTEIDKADVLGARLVGSAPESARIVLEELGKRNNISLRNEESAPQFIIEVMVFYMHLIDREAFAYLGAAKRETFSARFVETVLKESTAGLTSVSPDAFGRTLRDTYNRRQMQYAKYKFLVPEEGEPLKDTLYWEFSKILFAFLDDSNPGTLVSLNVRISHIANVMMSSALKAEEVLRS